MALIRSDPETLRRFFFNRGGLQRANRFDVFINVEGVGTLTYPAQSLSLPGRSFLGTSDELVAQGANPRTVPVKRAYGGESTILLGFYVDQNWTVRKFFEDWADLFYPMTRAFGFGEALVKREGSYQALAESCTMNLLFYDLNDNVKWNLRIIEPYISTIIQESYSQEMMNQMAMLNVAIAFKEYIPEIGFR